MNRTTTLFIATCSIILLSYLIWGDTEKGVEQQLTVMAANPGKYALFSYALLSSDIVLPIPNSIIMYANGYVLGSLVGAGLSLLALMTGAIAGYWLGRLSRYGLRAATEPKTIHFWDRYGALAILVTRGIPVVSESICILGGHVRMPFGKYLWMNLLGYIPVCLLFACFGQFGYNQSAFLLSLGCSFGLAGLFWWWGKSTHAFGA